MKALCRDLCPCVDVLFVQMVPSPSSSATQVWICFASGQDGGPGGGGFPSQPADGEGWAGMHGTPPPSPPPFFLCLGPNLRPSRVLLFRNCPHPRTDSENTIFHFFCFLGTD